MPFFFWCPDISIYFNHKKTQFPSLSISRYLNVMKPSITQFPFTWPLIERRSAAAVTEGSTAACSWPGTLSHCSSLPQEPPYPALKLGSGKDKYLAVLAWLTGSGRALGVAFSLQSEHNTLVFKVSYSISGADLGIWCTLVLTHSLSSRFPLSLFTSIDLRCSGNLV